MSDYLKEKVAIYEKAKLPDARIAASKNVERANKLALSNEDFISYLNRQFLSPSDFFGYNNWGYDASDQDRTNNQCETINHAFKQATSNKLKTYLKGVTAVYDFLSGYIARPANEVFFFGFSSFLLSFEIQRLEFRRTACSQFIEERSEKIASFLKLSKRKQKKQLISHMKELRPVMTIEPDNETVTESV